MSFTPEQVSELYRNLFERMLKAGWLLNFVFVTGKGWRLGWTEEGAIRSAILKGIALKFSLNDDDRAPVAFDIVAHGGSLPVYARKIRIDDTVAAIWQDSIETLQLPREEDQLIVLVSAVITWAPDIDGPLGIE